MKKGLLFTLFLSGSLLIAGQYAKLKDGTIIILKDDGTWEKVETIPTQAAPSTTDATPTATPTAAPAASAPSQPQKNTADPLADDYRQKLRGAWKSTDGALRYRFEEKEAHFTEGRKKRHGAYYVEHINPSKRAFILHIGEVGRSGPFSFGGVMRKMHFSDDFSTLTDDSALIPTTLQKVR